MHHILLSHIKQRISPSLSHTSFSVPMECSPSLSIPYVSRISISFAYDTCPLSSSVPRRVAYIRLCLCRAAFVSRRPVAVLVALMGRPVSPSRSRGFLWIGLPASRRVPSPQTAGKRESDNTYLGYGTTVVRLKLRKTRKNSEALCIST